MRAAATLVLILGSFPAASEDSTGRTEEPSVEILGVEIIRGMPEAEIRSSLSSLRCGEDDPRPGFKDCFVSDGVPPGVDGEITFKEGLVYTASRNWFIPADAEPLDVMIMLNNILTQLTGEEDAACAKVETHRDQEPTYIIFALPEKVLTVQMHDTRRGHSAHFRESLRVNPVPDSYKTRGKKMQGDEWCAYVN